MTLVASGKFDFPPAQAGSVPNPFVYRIPFNQVPSFSYNGSVPLVWQVDVQGTTNYSYIVHDACSGSSTNPLLAIARFGTGCTIVGQPVAMRLSGGSIMNWPNRTGTLSLTGGFGPPSSPVLYAFGFQKGLIPIGACQIWTDPLLVIRTNAGLTGRSQMIVPVPANPGLHGVNVYAQIGALDPTTNTLATSNALDINWVAPFNSVPVGQVFSWPVNGQLPPFGTVTPHRGLVVRFER